MFTPGVIFLGGKIVPYLVLLKPSALLNQLLGFFTWCVFFFGAQNGVRKKLLEKLRRFEGLKTKYIQLQGITKVLHFCWRTPVAHGLPNV